MKTAKHILGLALVGGLIALVAPSAAWADTFNIAASERGWVCTPSPSCAAGNVGTSNNGATPFNNYVAGFSSGQGQFRDWFEFAIPTLTGGSLVSATLNLDQPGVEPGHVGGALTYAVYGLSGQPVVFTDVSTSNPFGSVGTSSASDGTTVVITLNAAALAAIGADQGGFIFIGGIDSGENSNVTAVDFASTVALQKTVLDLQTASVMAPEPSSLFLLGAGLLGLAGARRRKRLA